jgi:hypothetical protein
MLSMNYAHMFSSAKAFRLPHLELINNLDKKLSIVKNFLATRYNLRS